MTAIAARVGPGASAADPAPVSRMLAAMRTRGADRVEHWLRDDVTLGVARYDWERAMAASRYEGIAHRGPLSIAADASLYYRDDLKRAIVAAGVEPRSDAPTELILAAYEAFGDQCAQRLEGDFAFIVWDQRHRRLFAARDFIGKRPLYIGTSGTSVAMASTIGGVLADGRIPDELNLRAIAAETAALWGHTRETCYRAIEELPAGYVATWDAEHGVSCARFWSPPSALDPRPAPMAEAAEELTALLTRAVDERIEWNAPTAVTLSGGWDSTAVYGAGRNALRAAPSDVRSLRPVSISYPEGDPGREDDLILATTRHWGDEPEWISSTDIPMFEDVRERARARDEPFAHPYDRWHRALARGGRRVGARVILDGSGGDQIFQVSNVYLADLFRTGRWIEMMRQWRSRGGKGVRPLLSAAVRPALSPRVLRLLARIRGAGEPLHHLDRKPSIWFRPAYLESHAILERELDAKPPMSSESAVLGETHAYLLFPYFARVTGRVSDIGLDEGVELRSPLLDSRVVTFGVRRPWYERADKLETKILLRRSMRGLLPDAVLAPRPHRTGTTTAYFNASMQGAGRPLVEEMIRDPLLAAAGVIDPAILTRAWNYYLRTGNDEVGARIWYTVQTELWLRERGSLANQIAAAAVTPKSAT